MARRSSRANNSTKFFIGFLVIGLLTASLEAGFFSNLKDKLKLKKKKKSSSSSILSDSSKAKTKESKEELEEEFQTEKDWDRYLKSNPDHLLYREPKRYYSKRVPLKWSLDMKQHVTGPIWLGTTYKEVALSREEFQHLRERMLAEELEIVKRSYIDDKKSQVKKEEEEEDEDENNERIDDFLSGGDDEEEKVAKNDDEKYLSDFNEGSAKRAIITRLVVPQTKMVLTDAVYFQLKNNDLYSVDLETGITIWIKRLSNQITNKPFETNKAVYILLSNQMHVIDKRTGGELHRLHISRAVMDLPYATEQTVYMAGYRRRLYSFDPHKNIVKWQKYLSGQPSLGIFGTSDDVIVIPQHNGELTAYNLDGRRSWVFVNKGISEQKVYLEAVRQRYKEDINTEQSNALKFERRPNRDKIRTAELAIEGLNKKILNLKDRPRASYEAPPVFDGNSLFIGATDFSFYKLDRHTGSPIWKYMCDAPIKEKAYVGVKVVWQRDSKGNLHEIDKETGLPNRVLKNIDSVVGSFGSTIFVEQHKTLKVVSPSKVGHVLGIDNNQYFVQGERGLLVYQPKRRKFAFYHIPYKEF